MQGGATRSSTRTNFSDTKRTRLRDSPTPPTSSSPSTGLGSPWSPSSLTAAAATLSFTTDSLWGKSSSLSSPRGTSSAHSGSSTFPCARKQPLSTHAPLKVRSFDGPLLQQWRRCVHEASASRGLNLRAHRAYMRSWDRTRDHAAHALSCSSQDDNTDVYPTNNLVRSLGPNLPLRANPAYLLSASCPNPGCRKPRLLVHGWGPHPSHEQPGGVDRHVGGACVHYRGLVRNGRLDKGLGPSRLTYIRGRILSVVSSCTCTSTPRVYFVTSRSSSYSINMSSNAVISASLKVSHSALADQDLARIVSVLALDHSGKNSWSELSDTDALRAIHTAPHQS